MSKAAVLLGVVAVQSSVLECSEPWMEFRDRLYHAANPNVRYFAVATQEVLSLASNFQADGGDCPLGKTALHLVEVLQVDQVEWQKTLSADFDLLQDLGWVNLLRSGWPIFQLLYLLHKHVKHLPMDSSKTCLAKDGYLKTLQLALHHQPKRDNVGLTASSLSFLSRSASSCPPLASAAILAIAWARLPVYDLETEGLLHQAEQMSPPLVDLVFAHSNPLPLVAARLAAAQQLSIHLREDEAVQDVQARRTLCCSVQLAMVIVVVKFLGL